MNRNPRLIEIRLFLVLVPLINIFNYYLTYNNISFSWRTAITFIIDTMLGYAAWTAVHLIIQYLDKKFPFEKNILRRLLIQITTTLLAGMSIIILLTVIIHYSLKDDPLPIGFFTYDIFIISVWFLVINGIYVSVHFYCEWQAAQNKRDEENRIKAGGLKVKSGKQEIILRFEEIAGFNMDGEYVVCFTLAGKKFLLDQSMEKLEKLLPSPWFFRLNRQFLLHRQIITGFERAENGKLNVLVKPSPFSSPINVSRIRAADFKNWFEPS